MAMSCHYLPNCNVHCTGLTFLSKPTSSEQQMFILSFSECDFTLMYVYLATAFRYRKETQYITMKKSETTEVELIPTFFIRPNAVLILGCKNIEYL